MIVPLNILSIHRKTQDYSLLWAYLFYTNDAILHTHIKFKLLRIGDERYLVTDEWIYKIIYKTNLYVFDTYHALSTPLKPKPFTHQHKRTSLFCIHVHLG